MQAKKGHKNFGGRMCGKLGVVLFGVKKVVDKCKRTA